MYGSGLSCATKSKFFQTWIILTSMKSKIRKAADALGKYLSEILE